MAFLQVQTTYNAKCLYTDAGTGANKDLSIWEPTLPTGYYMIGHYAQQNHSDIMGGPVPIVKPVDPKAIVTPTGFTRVYADHGTGGKQDMSLWMPTPPSNEYVAVGTVCSTNYNSPDHLLSRYACIRKDFVTQGEFPMTIWADHGSGGSEDVSIWAVQPREDSSGLTGYFIGQSGYNQPAASLGQCLKGLISA